LKPDGIKKITPKAQFRPFLTCARNHTWFRSQSHVVLIPITRGFALNHTWFYPKPLVVLLPITRSFTLNHARLRLQSGVVMLAITRG